MESYITIKNRGYFEFEDRKSLFIGEAKPVSTEKEAIDFVNEIKKKYPDAKHHVYAYVLRENSIMRFSDDREPQGTAGMPTLDVIRKKMCTDVAIVVVRYFGGVLLGTGGLVHAYTTAASGALNDGEIVVFDLYYVFSIFLSYSDYQKIIKPLATSGFREEQAEYSDKVVITGRILKSRFDVLSDELIKITSGRIEIKIMAEKYDF